MDDVLLRLMSSVIENKLSTSTDDALSLVAGAFSAHSTKKNSLAFVAIVCRSLNLALAFACRCT